MKSERGAALILALMILCFLAAVAGALLTSTTFDIWVGDNYKLSAQLVYLAEAGIEDARQALSGSSATPSQLLAVAAGSDGALSTSRDLQTLLGKTDDIPFLSGANRTIGKSLMDLSGRPAGLYTVFLRNDPADGVSNLADSNQVLTLLSFGVIGSSTRTVEATVLKFRFPKLPAALTLDGSPVVFQAVDSDAFGINGLDPSSGGMENAVGVISTTDQLGVLQGIPNSRQANYPGNAVPNPPPADVGVIDGELDLRLKTIPGLENLVETILARSTDVYSPGWNNALRLGNIGAPAAPAIVSVNGDCILGPGSGYGMLVVRGNLTVHGSFSWMGLILVIGQGTMQWASDASGQVTGGVFIARTRDNDRSASNTLGTLRTTRGSVSALFNGSAAGIQLNTANVNLANARFPYVTIAFREY
jgi:Tfp pilus assembly protein PilX